MQNFEKHVPECFKSRFDRCKTIGLDESFQNLPELLKKVLSASSYGHFTATKEFRSQCHIFRFENKRSKDQKVKTTCDNTEIIPTEIMPTEIMLIWLEVNNAHGKKKAVGIWTVRMLTKLNNRVKKQSLTWSVDRKTETCYVDRKKETWSVDRKKET